MDKIGVITVKALSKYHIHIRFSDGTEGTLDLSGLAGKGVFKSWDEDDNFNKVFISEESGAITWPGELDIDTLNCYLQVKGISYEQYKSLQQKTPHALG